MSEASEERTEPSTSGTGDDGEDESVADDEVRAHLEDVEDGCGCAEVWEHLSAGRGE